ncbi:MAG: hypothetical protein ACJ8GW_09805 [Massilia sp.]
MHNPTKSAIVRPLYCLLLLMFVDPIASVLLARQASAMSLWHLLSGLAFSFTTFLWYCRDSDAHGYRRSVWRNIGINFLGWVCIPVYLVRSRAKGQKWRALWRVLGFFVLLIFAMLVGGLLISALATLI